MSVACEVGIRRNLKPRKSDNNPKVARLKHAAGEAVSTSPKDFVAESLWKHLKSKERVALRGVVVASGHLEESERCD